MISDLSREDRERLHHLVRAADRQGFSTPTGCLAALGRHLLEHSSTGLSDPAGRAQARRLLVGIRQDRHGAREFIEKVMSGQGAGR